MYLGKAFILFSTKDVVIIWRMKTKQGTQNSKTSSMNLYFEYKELLKMMKKMFKNKSRCCDYELPFFMASDVFVLLSKLQN